MHSANPRQKFGSSSLARESSKDLSSQIWIFLYEEMTSSKFRVSTKTTTEMIKTPSFSLEIILRMLDLKHSDHTKYAFWITSSSMRSAVALLNDSSVHVTYELYCKKDPVITVIVRPERDPSPNSSQTPSAEDSLRERQKVSGQQKLQNVSVRQRYSSNNRQLEALSCGPVSDLPEDEKIMLDIGDGRTEAFTTSYLISECGPSPKWLNNLLIPPIVDSGRG